MLRVLVLFPAPMDWADCIMNPIAIAFERLPRTQVEEATSPIEALAFSPRLPTIAASIYCITIEEICVRIPGIERSQT